MKFGVLLAVLFLAGCGPPPNYKFHGTVVKVDRPYIIVKPDLNVLGEVVIQYPPKVIVIKPTDMFHEGEVGTFELPFDYGNSKAQSLVSFKEGQ